MNAERSLSPAVIIHASRTDIILHPTTIEIEKGRWYVV